MDVKDLSTKEIVAHYNQLSDKKVQKFVNRATAEQRLTELLQRNNAHIGDDRLVHQGEGDKEPTVKQLTEDFNRLVPTARELGIKVKHHTSLFGSKDAARRQLTVLKQKIQDAKKPKLQEAQ